MIVAPPTALAYGVGCPAAVQAKTACLTKYIWIAKSKILQIPLQIPTPSLLSCPALIALFSTRSLGSFRGSSSRKQPHFRGLLFFFLSSFLPSFYLVFHVFLAILVKFFFIHHNFGVAFFFFFFALVLLLFVVLFYSIRLILLFIQSTCSYQPSISLDLPLLVDILIQPKRHFSSILPQTYLRTDTHIHSTDCLQSGR